jgi:hypothetical protein
MIVCVEGFEWECKPKRFCTLPIVESAVGKLKCATKCNNFVFTIFDYHTNYITNGDKYKMKK